jgi:hypothetical protein
MKKTKNKRKAKIRTVRFPEGNRNAPNTKTINCEILATPHRKINHHKYPKWDSHSSCVQLFIPRRKNNFQTNFIISHHFDVCWYCRVIHPSLACGTATGCVETKDGVWLASNSLCDDTSAAAVVKWTALLLCKNKLGHVFFWFEFVYDRKRSKKSKENQ